MFFNFRQMIGAIIKKISIKLFGWEWYEVLKGEFYMRTALNKKPKYDRRYSICICAIFKDEAQFLKEWIEYHRIVGIEHFFLYNNNSTDEFEDILQPYIEQNLVTLIDFPYEQAQMKAYQNFYETYRHETQWVTFLDIDEFLCPNSHLTLQEWIKDYEKYPVIQMYWKMFGTSGFLSHDDTKLVTEQYVVSWKNLFHCGKCFINTDYDIVYYDSSMHHCPDIYYPLKKSKIQLHPFNIFHRATFGQKLFLKTDETSPSIQINHYWSKAFDLYDKKRNKTDVYYKENPKKDIKMFLWHENQNSSVDYNIFKFMIQLKFKMNNISW